MIILSYDATIKETLTQENKEVLKNAWVQLIKCPIYFYIEFNPASPN